MDLGLTVIIIVAIIALYNFIDLFLRHQREMAKGGDTTGEIEALKERVRVLERITVEEGNSLAAEIAALEDRVGAKKIGRELSSPDHDDVKQTIP